MESACAWHVTGKRPHYMSLFRQRCTEGSDSCDSLFHRLLRNASSHRHDQSRLKRDKQLAKLVA